jgi:hypothetical protein
LETDDSVAHTGEKSLKVVGIIATGTALNARIRHGAIPVKVGETVTVAFWAKVDANEGHSREVDVSAQMQEEPWSGFYRNTIVLDSTDWKEYTDTFVATTDGVMWIGLSVAQSDVDFWIDDFRFFEGGPSDEIKEIESAVNQMCRVPTSWGSVKSRY